MRSWLSAMALMLFVAACPAQPEQKSAFSYRYRLAEGSSAAAPVLILLHGYGSDENDLFSLAPRLPFKMNVFSLRAPVSLPQGGYAWYLLGARIGDRWQYDYAEARRARASIVSFIREICKTHHCDSSRVYLLGFSQGAIMSYDVALNASGLIRGIAALSGAMMPESKPEKPASLRTSFFIGHGKNDEVIPLARSAAADDYLRQLGVPVTFRTYEAAHQIPEAELRDLDVWFRQQSR